MLAWMLAHFLNDEDFSRFRNLGERAVQMNVLKYIDRALNNDVIVGNFAVASVVNSVAFAVSSVLVIFQISFKSDVPLILYRILSELAEWFAWHSSAEHFTLKFGNHVQLTLN